MQSFLQILPHVLLYLYNTTKTSRKTLQQFLRDPQRVIVGATAVALIGLLFTFLMPVYMLLERT